MISIATNLSFKGRGNRRGATGECVVTMVPYPPKDKLEVGMPLKRGFLKKFKKSKRTQSMDNNGA